MLNHKLKNKKNGFVLLFTTVLSSIIFAVAMGVLNIALKESVFTTSGKASNEAFYAADTGVECAMYYDLQYKANGLNSAFGAKSAGGPNPTILPETFCAGLPVDLYQGSDTGPWTFYIRSLGPNGRACAIVEVTKTTDPVSTYIVSRGYSTGGNTDNCTSANVNRVERRLEVNY